MDSITQITLGAAVAVAMTRKNGTPIYKAAIIGGICGTLPDLDVLIDYGDPVSNFTKHRGFSHSLLFCFLITPLLSVLFGAIRWFEWQRDNLFALLAIGLVLLTHIGLDALTIYGTQIFWPLNAPPVGLGSIFIIDPFYTLPLLAGLVVAIGGRSWRSNAIGLAVSTAYLIWAISAQAVIRAEIIAANPQIDSTQIMVQATPFNTLLWRVVIISPKDYKVAYVSVLDGNGMMAQNYNSYPRYAGGISTQCIDGANNTAYARLEWFTRGFNALSIEEDGTTRLSDLRMGIEPTGYTFSFRICDDAGKPIRPVHLRGERDYSVLERMYDRIWNANVIVVRALK